MEELLVRCWKSIVWRCLPSELQLQASSCMPPASFGTRRCCAWAGAQAGHWPINTEPAGRTLTCAAPLLFLACALGHSPGLCWALPSRKKSQKRPVSRQSSGWTGDLTAHSLRLPLPPIQWLSIPLVPLFRQHARPCANAGRRHRLFCGRQRHPVPCHRRRHSAPMITSIPLRHGHDGPIRQKR